MLDVEMENGCSKETFFLNPSATWCVWGKIADQSLRIPQEWGEHGKSEIFQVMI
jgi:hypothetical protein